MCKCTNVHTKRHVLLECLQQKYSYEIKKKHTQKQYKSPSRIEWINNVRWGQTMEYRHENEWFKTNYLQQHGRISCILLGVRRRQIQKVYVSIDVYSLKIGKTYLWYQSSDLAGREMNRWVHDGVCWDVSNVRFLHPGHGYRWIQFINWSFHLGFVYFSGYVLYFNKNVKKGEKHLQHYPQIFHR